MKFKSVLTNFHYSNKNMALMNFHCSHRERRHMVAFGVDSSYRDFQDKHYWDGQFVERMVEYCKWEWHNDSKAQNKERYDCSSYSDS